MCEFFATIDDIDIQFEIEQCRTGPTWTSKRHRRLSKYSMIWPRGRWGASDLDKQLAVMIQSFESLRHCLEVCQVGKQLSLKYSTVVTESWWSAKLAKREQGKNNSNHPKISFHSVIQPHLPYSVSLACHKELPRPAWCVTYFRPTVKTPNLHKARQRWEMLNDDLYVIHSKLAVDRDDEWTSLCILQHEQRSWLEFTHIVQVFLHPQAKVKPQRWVEPSVTNDFTCE